MGSTSLLAEVMHEFPQLAVNLFFKNSRSIQDVFYRIFNILKHKYLELVLLLILVML